METQKINADSEQARLAEGARNGQKEPAGRTSVAAPGGGFRRWKIVLCALVGAPVLFWTVRWVAPSFNTASTDDAYVNSYVTFVAPRVSGQVTRVLVDDNNRVRKGDLLS